jgi:hypothetical protein
MAGLHIFSPDRGVSRSGIVYLVFRIPPSASGFPADVQPPDLKIELYGCVKMV